MDANAMGENSGAPDDADLGGRLRTVVWRLYRRVRSQRLEGSLGDTALDVLTRLYKNGPQTLTELSDFDHVAPGSMSQSVNRLTSAGYAIRTPDPKDRRKVLFCATPKGAELALAERNERHAWLDRRLRALSLEDQSVIARACALLGEI